MSNQYVLVKGSPNILNTLFKREGIVLQTSPGYSMGCFGFPHKVLGYGSLGKLCMVQVDCTT